MAYTAADLRLEYATFASGDPWGECMEWWFGVAAEMYERGLPIPDAWRYRPSPLGAKDPDAFVTPILEEATDDALQEFGALLTRYASRLKHAGMDY